MKPPLLVFPVLAFVAFGLSSLSVSAQPDPASILQYFVAARNQADEVGTIALLADNMSYVGGSACLPANPCIGTQDIRADVHQFIADHAQSTLIGLPSVSGTTVTARAETSNDAVRAAGLERIVFEYVVDVQYGKLKTFRTVEDMSDSQTAAFQAFQSRQQLDAAAPVVHPQCFQWRDAGYLEPKQAVDTPAVSVQARDAWYLAPTLVVSGRVPSSPARDRWYLELNKAVPPERER